MSKTTYKQRLLEHLGIVAGICNEIELIKTIDAELPKPKRKVSVGEAVQSMILNALGFSNRALYLHTDFYLKKPVELLVGEHIRAEDLNDDCLGSALDALYEYGVTELFYKQATKALKIFNIKHRFVHLDTTSLTLQGKYEQAASSEPEVISITKGYSKDNHPELNQVIVSMMCSYKSTIPIWIEALSGNSSDKKSFPQTIQKFKEQFQAQSLPYFVADSALYSEDGLKELDAIKWLSRVPETMKLAKEAIYQTDKAELEAAPATGYFYKEVEASYADIPQRWLIVFSQKAYDREYATMAKKIRQENEKMGKELWHLENRAFACEADAQQAVNLFNRKLKFHKAESSVEVKNYYQSAGRPDKNQAPHKQEYHIAGSLIINAEAVKEAQKRKGFFIIATNELDKQKLTIEQMLNVYKSQGVSVERGFRFLKDPMFFAESLYLKSPKRIMALIMVMALSLLVYSLAERKLRKVLKEKKLSIKNQLKRPTERPTIRWVFQRFEDLMLLYIYKDDKLTQIQCELTEDQTTVIACLGEQVKKMYFFDF